MTRRPVAPISCTHTHDARHISICKLRKTLSHHFGWYFFFSIISSFHFIYRQHTHTHTILFIISIRKWKRNFVFISLSSLVLHRAYGFGRWHARGMSLLLPSVAELACVSLCVCTFSCARYSLWRVVFRDVTFTRSPWTMQPNSWHSNEMELYFLTNGKARVPVPLHTHTCAVRTQINTQKMCGYTHTATIVETTDRQRKRNEQKKGI